MNFRFKLERRNISGQLDADGIGGENGERLDPAAFNRSCSLRTNDENEEEGMEVEGEEHGHNGEDDEADDIDDDGQQWPKPKLVTIFSSSYSKNLQWFDKKRFFEKLIDNFLADMHEF